MKLGALIVVCLLAVSQPSPAAEPAGAKPTARQIEFFEKKIRPLLANHCYECHGAETQESGLRLDSLAAALKGGKAGPALTPGKPKQSLIVTAVSYQDSELRMPPEEQLSKAEIADLTRWVELGAPHPDGLGAAPIPVKSNFDLQEAREFWAFQPPADPHPPRVRDASWATSPLDLFILSQLEAAGLRPNPPADKRTLIRRATFDLTGLPPTPEEIERFVADDSPEAFARVVERLLDSPHYGERWGRHWLDVARYADSNGLDENIAYGNAWRYRDYVVASFNSDKPFDQFVLEQLAGDLLPKTGDEALRRERLIATGFLALGPKVLAEVDETKMEMDIVDEQINTVSSAFLGLTLGCARCHDHKFDPLLTADYYALAGVFKSTRTMETFTKVARWYENSLATADDLERQARHKAALAEKQEAIAALIQRANERLKAAGSKDFKLPKQPEPLYPAETRAELKRLRDELKAIEGAAPVIPTALGVTEGDAADVPIHVRGSHLTLGAVAPRRFPVVLAGASQPAFDSDASGRLRLARWLVEPDHPLTSRVIVNRVWRWRFGRGLVATPDNFGRLGERPVNQPLLDWLSRRFVEQGWSFKKLHRLMMLSSTYRMSSDFNAASAKIDPENRLQWRANVRRLEAEAIRDSLLAVSGQLDTTLGGSLLHVKNREYLFNHTSQDGTKYDSRRRSLYLPVVRNHIYDVFQLFDYSDASVLNGNRPTTTVAPQALFMLNGDLVCQAAEDLAAEIGAGKAKLRTLYLRAYGRPPTRDELARARRFLQTYQQTASAKPDTLQSRQDAFRALCHAVLASNEFVYVR